MCEIFSAIGAAILGSSAIGASTAATTAVGVAATASTVAGVAGTGLGIANSVRASHESSSARSMQNAIAQSSNRLSVEKTAEQLKENKLSSRTLASLRIPLNKTVDSSVNTSQGNSAVNTGVNIPI